MPKRVKQPTKPKRSSDPNQWARQLVDETTAEPEATLPKAPAFAAQLSAYMSKLGKKGGQVSGAKRMVNLSDSARSEIALRAATARWDKERAKKKRTK